MQQAARRVEFLGNDGGKKGGEGEGEESFVSIYTSPLTHLPSEGLGLNNLQSQMVSTYGVFFSQGIPHQFPRTQTEGRKGINNS